MTRSTIICLIIIALAFMVSPLILLTGCQSTQDRQYRDMQTALEIIERG